MEKKHKKLKKCTQGATHKKFKGGERFAGKQE
jgi:hypothetical protein